MKFLPLTDIVGCVAGCLEGVPGVSLLRKPKVSQLQHPHVVCNNIVTLYFIYLQLPINFINICVHVSRHLAHIGFFLGKE